LHRLDADRQSVDQRIRGKLAAIETEESAAGLDLGIVADGDRRTGAVGTRDLDLVTVAG
jgi:hypothetical protein